jgi:hypothetical protein
MAPAAPACGGYESDVPQWSSPFPGGVILFGDRDSERGAVVLGQVHEVH